jgi:PAS domain S-box-containing protein
VISARILIAEDELIIADELRERLIGLGVEVVGIASRADEAVALADKTRPDLALMDIRLKGPRDGIQAAVVLGEWDIPVIFLTAHSDEDTVKRAAVAAPSGYLIKPVRERELEITVKMALHKRALERDLRASEERFVTTLASIADGVIATDAERRITFINPVAEGLTHWPAADAVGRPVAEVFHVVDAGTRRRLPCPVARALDERGAVTLDDNAVLIARDGTECAVDDSAAPIRDSRGEFSGAVLVFRDITAKIAAADAISKAEERLRQGEKLEALGRLAGGIAHDINNMMTVVAGCADMMLADMAADDPHRDLALEIKQAGDRSANIARQLLAFSRRQVLKAEVLDLNLVVSGLEPMLRRLIREDVALNISLAERPCRVEIDRTQVEQVLMNLSVNARDAMHEGGTLSIALTAVDFDPAEINDGASGRAGKYVRLEVKDTGVGMNIETRRQIFEPFFTTKEVGRGTGLGLATVYGIVTQSNGHMTVTSEPGRGSTFSVYLPVVAGPHPVHTHPRGESPPEQTAETVLLVEDDVAVKRLTQTFLERAGFQVIATTSGHEALRLVAGGLRPTLLLADAVMPAMSGRTLVGLMTAELPDLRVLYMSGYTEDEALRRGIFVNDVAFIGKPFSAAALVRRVRETIDNGPAKPR